MSQPPRTRLRPTSRLVLGVLLILVAMVLFGASRLIAGSQRHAYDPHASPPPTYHLTAGKQYQLATSGGMAALAGSGALATGSSPSCAATADTGQNDPLTIDAVTSDDRDLHVIATFTAQATGVFHVHCDRIAAVFVDDADDSARDWSAVGVLAAALLGLVGAAMAVSGAYQVDEDRRRPGTGLDESQPADRDGGESDEPRVQVAEGPVDHP